MSPNQLQNLASGYLEAEGYEVEARPKNLLDGRRAAIGGGNERILVWVPGEEGRAPLTRRLQSFVGDFGTYADRAPQASKFFLVPSTAGLTTEFRRTAQFLNVKILVPSQFFDTEMRWELGAGASPSRRLADAGSEALARRVPQPATFDYEQGSTADLLPFLFEELRSADGLPIHLVVGPAGMGKSFLFEALYSKLYDKFQEDKRGQVFSRRPFALLPDHLRRGSAESATVGSILSDYLGSEFARNLTRSSFEWRLTNGGGIWLIDGLDEIIARDADFFSDLFDLETSTGSTPAKILICVRDSLLSTDQELREFCAYHRDEMKLYRLEPWGRESLQLYSQMRFDTGTAKRFVEQLSASPDLTEIASVPFYASILAEEFEAGALEREPKMVELLDSALHRILEREYDKELLDRTTIPSATVIEILESLAGKDFEEGFRGVLVSDVRDYAQIELPADMDSDQLDRYVSNFTQLALFVNAGEGIVRFLQEPIEQFLLGGFLASRVNNEPLFLAKLAGRAVPSDWVTWDVVSSRVRMENRQGSLLPMADQVRFRPAFNNLMRLVASLGPSDVPLREFPLTGADLSEIKFTGFDLTGVSFDDADLTNTTFEDCTLTNARFEGAVFANTAFLGTTIGLMQGLAFGDLSSLHSIRSPDGQIDDHHLATAWLLEHSATRESVVEPCPAARQLRLLFGKYVTPLGDPKRSKLPLGALTRGQKIYDQARTLEEAMSHGYLTRPDYRDHVSRGDGSHYSEMVGWVRTFTMSSGLRDLLDDLCNISDCEHVPRTH